MTPADLRTAFSVYAQAAKDSMPVLSPATSTQSADSVLKEEVYNKIIEAKEEALRELQVRIEPSL